MNRSLVIGVIGVVIIAAALVLNFFINPDSPNGDDSTLSQPADGAGPGAGNASGAGQSGPTAPSAAPTPTPSPTAPSPPTVPSFDVVRVNPRGDAVIAGRAPPNAEVTVRDQDGVIGTVTADRRGEWVLIPERPLAPGQRELSISSILADGTRREGDAKVLLVVPGRGAAVAEITPGKPGAAMSGGAGAAAPDGALALKVPRGGDGPISVLQRPQSGPPAPPGAPTIEAVEQRADGSLVISGGAAPGAKLQIYLDNEPVGAAEADQSGRWTLIPEGGPYRGNHTLRVDQLGAGGAVMARAEAPLQWADALRDLPEGVLVFVEPGNSLWRIARRVYGEGTRFGVIYAANRDQIRDPNLIYPGQIFLLPKTN